MESAQTLVNRDSLIVFQEDGTATIYLKKDVSDVTKGKAEVAVKPTPNSGKWSQYQGYMNWEDAKKKCASIGMRLPTVEELKAAYAAVKRLKEFISSGTRKAKTTLNYLQLDIKGYFFEIDNEIFFYIGYTIAIFGGAY